MKPSEFWRGFSKCTGRLTWRLATADDLGSINRLKNVSERFLGQPQRNPSLFRMPVLLALVAENEQGKIVDCIYLEAQVELVNYKGTERVAAACAECGCRLVFLSTTSVYGTQDTVVDENCSAGQLKPQSPYAESKLRAERLLTEMGPREGLKFVICRFGTIYGTSIGMRFHTAVNKFVWQAVNGLPITVWRTALDQKRPYLDLGDAVRAVRFILETSRFDNQIYNVLTDNSSVGEIVAIIREFVPDLKVELVDSPIMNQLSYTVLCDKFRALGFAFKGDMREGIGETARLLRGLPQVLAKMLGVPVKVAPDPLTAVVRGAGIVTEDPEPYKDFFIDEEDILSEA